MKKPLHIIKEKRIIRPSFISRHGDIIPTLVSYYGLSSGDESCWWSITEKGEPQYPVGNEDIIQALNHSFEDTIYQ